MFSFNAITDSFSSFRAAFPEWCEEVVATNPTHPAKTAPPAEQLMGLRYISLMVIRFSLAPLCNGSIVASGSLSRISEVIINLFRFLLFLLFFFFFYFRSSTPHPTHNKCIADWLNDQLNRSLRISTSDSACSSTESSDCESTSHIQVHGAPVEILPGLFLGNATHSKDSRALQRYNIQVSGALGLGLYVDKVGLLNGP